MRGIVVGVGALLGLLVCIDIAPAAVAGGDSPLSSTELFGKQGFVQEFIRVGDVRENAPGILAGRGRRKKRKRRRKKSGSDSYVSSSGGGAFQIDPNTAELKKLMMLPLLSREEAEAIIEYRKKDRIDTHEEILEIEGVKPSHYRIFKHLIVIREEASGELGSATAAPQVY